MNRLTKRTLLSTAIAVATFQAHGAGFQISEHSASGLGRAFAGEAAIADNAAVAARNPAAMTMFDSAQLSGGISFIQPDVDAKVTSSELAISNPPTQTGSENYSDVAPDAFVPNIHYIHPLNDKMAVGFSAFSNFGLATEYPTDAIAGPGAGKSELATVDFNANFAYEINEQLSLGLGLNAVYADASLTRNTGSLAPILSSPATDETANLSGDGWGFGWNIGALWHINEKNRLGFAYRSEVDITLDGEYRGTSTAFAGKPGQTVPGELELNLPDIFEFSGYHELAPKWAMHYSVMRVGWSSFQELRATGASSDCINGGSEPGVCLQKDEKWDDSWRYAIGATHYLNNKWTLRAGFARDESPVPDEHRTLSIPDTDRNWYTIGATYQATKALTIDGGFAYLNGDTASGTETESVATYNFEAGGDAYIYSVSANYTF
ncbi:porin [Enterovibrio norvegicus]|uniref:Long-chain fatty acid transporter n=1 Tax=Enterovibrio norvegicus TaxID=188144 RepID=A0A2N7L9K6_9GAMM|nr:porin [Enterovibrio norvegicus]PML75464.1 long-chain fatty acid transporter [Enterovibrio norvegicus]PMN73784.1 long-chain fatty acid transporter [Enterovibrio norvegicus]PMN91251.1 long-chain fatty acid transporter [Enterovibrio norvegicus]